MRAKRCFLIHCMNDETTLNISFCKLPPDESQREIWLRFINLANGERERRKYSLNSVQICSDHFEKACFGAQGKRLKKKSNPTLINGRVIQPSSTHLVPRITHPYDLWENVITLNNLISQYENEVFALRKSLQHKQEQIESYRTQLHVYQQNEKRHTAAKMKRKAENCSRKHVQLHENASQTETALSVFDTTKSSGTFLHEVHARLTNPTKAFSDYMKQIAFELHFRSPCTYEFLRKELDKALPHSKTLGIWTKPIKAGPGIISECMDFLRKQQSQSKYQLYYALMFDEIHIKQDVKFHGDRMVGFVDFGGLAPAVETDRLAKTALFFLINQINGNKKIPVAYALTDGINKDILTTIIKNVLTALHDANARVLTVTFDGLPTNLSAIEELGANLNPRSPTFQPWFLHPSSPVKIFVILDPCHMLKLIRNVWKKERTFYTPTGKKIEWNFITSLNSLQEECGLKAANKLSSSHVNFENDKMKTKLCVQTLSNSVCVAIRVCRELGQAGFENSQETEVFISTMNKLFDILNSRVGGKNYSSPLKQSNHDLNKEWLTKCREYLSEILIDEKGLHKNIMSTRKATGVKGLIITITSLLYIMEEIIMNPNEDLQYLPVYKCVQDHLEMYFGSIRGRHGRNNNPSVKQVAYAVRDLLCMKIKDLITGNCYPLEDLSTQISPFRSLKNLESEDGDPSYDVSTVDDEDLAIFNLDANLFANNIVVYVSGFVVKKLCQKLSCALCICMLCPSDSERPSLVTSHEFLLLVTRDNGGLHVPCRSVVHVCKIAESSVRFWEQKGLKGLKKESIISTCLRECVKQGLVSQLTCGLEDSTKPDIFSSHGMDLVKQIASEFVKVRLHHIARVSTLRANPSSIRRVCTKLIHFKNN